AGSTPGRPAAAALAQRDPAAGRAAAAPGADRHARGSRTLCGLDAGGADRDMITPSDLLATGLVLPAVAEPAHDLPAGATCAITGAPISRGYLVADMVTVATTEFLDGFRGGVHGHVSESAARCFRSANPRAGNPCARSHLAFEDGTYYAPLIALEAATAQSRPCWSDLVRAVWPARQGQQVLCLLTTDTKKRLWHKARVGALGPRTPVYLYDNPTNEQQTAPLDWAKLLDCLDLVERAYDLGFAKPAIRESLLS